MRDIPTSDRPARLALIGARGYVGSELIRLISAHPRLQLVRVASRSLAGARVGEHIPVSELHASSARDIAALTFESLGPDDVAECDADVYVLALPNGLAPGYVDALDRSASRGAVVLDVSADHRFDDAWAYGQPERFRAAIRAATRIANPGCYATGAQLAIWPLVDQLAEPPHIFGVSGYSGAGTTPSPRNDPEKLRDNLMPYALTGHLHQREVSRHLGQRVFFSPHVAPFFRGIALTISMVLREPGDAVAIEARYRERYDAEPLVRVCGAEIPLVRAISGRHHVDIGGLSVDPTEPRHVVITATIDNLLKGAATQAMQNINLALGLDELLGIDLSDRSA